jgi:hypothetical protein
MYGFSYAAVHIKQEIPRMHPWDLLKKMRKEKYKKILSNPNIYILTKVRIN